MTAASDDRSALDLLRGSRITAYSIGLLSLIGGIVLLAWPTRSVEVVARIDRLEPATAPLTVGHDRGQFPEQTDAALEVLLRRADGIHDVEGAPRFAGPDDADRGAHLIHRMSIERDEIDRGLDVGL